LCGKEVGPLYCAKCRAKLKRSHDLIPVLFYDKQKKGYRAGCTCVECPLNENGVCRQVYPTLESLIKVLHEFDGDNIVHQMCG